MPNSGPMASPYYAYVCSSKYTHKSIYPVSALIGSKYIAAVFIPEKFGPEMILNSKTFKGMFVCLFVCLFVTQVPTK